MALTKSKQKKKSRTVSNVNKLKVVYNAKQRAILGAIRVAHQKILNKKTQKLFQCRGLKNFKSVEQSSPKIAKNETLSQQIPTEVIDLKAFDSNTIRQYIYQLQLKYEGFGGVKLILTDSTADSTSCLFDLIEGKESLSGFSYSYQQIQDGIFGRRNQSDDYSKLQLRKKCFSEKTFWKNINQIHVNHYGILNIKPPQYFLDCFPAINELFTSKFPQKKDELTYECIFGGAGSIFGWHIDYYNLAGVNLNMKGGDKLWYFIPKKQTQTFYSYLSQLPVKQGQIPCIRSHFSTIIHPSNLGYLQSTIQKQNQLIIIFPGVFHSGVNLGSNICFTSALATPKWLQQKPVLNCKCDFQLDDQMVKRMKIRYADFSSSLGIILEYQSMQSQSISNIELQKHSVSEFLACQGQKPDYLFQLQAKQGRCFFKECIRLSLLHKPMANKKDLVSLIPKFNKDENYKTRAFYNWSTLKQNLDGWCDISDSVEKKSEQQTIFVPKPTGTFCRVCNVSFLDYLSHINSKCHLENIKTDNKKYSNQWMIQLPHFGLINSTNKDNIKGFHICTHPKLNKKQQMLAKLILKADNSNCKQYKNILKQIKQLSKQMNHSQVVPYALKRCAICQAITELPEVLDSQWLVCNICNQKVHTSCLKHEKCPFCQTKPKAQVNQWEEIDSLFMVGIQSLGFINDIFQMAPNFNSEANNQMQVSHYLKSKGIKYRRYLTFYNNHIVQPFKVFYEPHIARVSYQLQTVYQKYQNGKYFPPVQIREISKKVGVGVFATQDIAKNTFLCEYGGDLIPAAFAHLNEKYNMDLLEGACTFSSLIITVIKTSSLGPLLNHSKSPNCRTLRCYIGNCIRIIMYTIQGINKGEQLTYNYNDAQKNYPTNDFRQFN